MRSHVAVYRAPETAPPLGTLAPIAPPTNYAPLRYHQHPLSHWPGNQQQQQQQQPGAPAYRLHPPPNHHQPPQNANYGVVNQQRINECAGIPLISNASSHLSPAQRQRLLRKSAPKTGPTWPPGGATMSQLAVHAQGMPLLQQNAKQHLQQHHQHNHQHNHHHHNPVASNWSSYQPMNSQSNFKLADKSRALRYQNSAPPVLSSQEKLPAASQDQANSSPTAAETCLPRIIKPRKRRKKDRKPGNGVLLKMESDMQQVKVTNPGEGYAGSYHLPAGLLQHDHTHGVCFCRECDPLRSLWDYPLRRSASDASSSEQGGGGSTSTSSTSSTHSDSSCDSSICSQPAAATAILQQEEETTEEFAPITGDSSRAEIVGVIGSQRSHPNAVTTPSQCLSDDSGYGDILSGINIANDLFGNCFRGGSSSSSMISAQAETLLDESLNEISRKLIETCNVADSGLGSASGSGAASDSGLDSAGSHNCESGLVFNFEHLNLTDATPTALDFLVDCNNNSSHNSLGLMWQPSGGGCHDDSQVAAAKLNPDSRATPTHRLILGTVGKLKPAFSTIS
ncbi:uncharacterized protein [Drosophila takahashii]|uniref:uncharacterized protein n=1 Tax=Drosophila takahashii TaxID=29030 RepID=UPI001CF86179|nr:uncharacterized protein LOC108065702 [Drosophila takahashii]